MVIKENDIELLVGQMVYRNEDVVKYDLLLQSHMLRRIYTKSGFIPLSVRLTDKGTQVFVPSGRVNMKGLQMLCSVSSSDVIRQSVTGEYVVLSVCEKEYEKINSYDLDIYMKNDNGKYVAVGVGMTKDPTKITLRQQDLSTEGLILAISKNLLTRVRAILQKAQYLLSEDSFTDVIDRMSLSPEMEALLKKYVNSAQQKVIC